MNRILYTAIASILLLIVFESSSCNGGEEPEPSYGKISFTFDHKMNGDYLKYDTILYNNAAGNPFLVNEIQYFVSDFRLWKDGKALLLDKWEDIHYVDTDIPDSWVYKPADEVPAGNYDSITFVFGITEEKNNSFMFVNPPESYMFWPEYLGGGYHYMKLNGKWRDPNNVVRPFNFHLGIGQTYDENGNITGFVQNYFTVRFPASFFAVVDGRITEANISMNIEEWFKDPNIFDFNYWGGDIMEKQDAMHAACENGHNVFSITFNEK